MSINYFHKDSTLLVNDDCLKVLDDLPDYSIDMTITSPPYDNMRKYDGLSWSSEVWKSVIKSLYRVSKDGAVVVWIVGDATIDGSETGTSFEQALFAKQCGFNLHDTMIYTKGGQGATGSRLAYWQDFEYMFVFSKGRPKSWNPLEDRKNKVAPGTRQQSQGHRDVNGNAKGKRLLTRKEFGRRFNVWQYHESGTRTKHPAKYPDALVRDHILSWSQEGDIILDPFVGSGTTCAVAVELGRASIGIELSEKYFWIAVSTLNSCHK